MASLEPTPRTSTLSQVQDSPAEPVAFEQVLDSLPRHTTSAAREGLERLHQFKPDDLDVRYPTHKLASVLVLLHIDRLGQLACTFTTRSTKLRSHPGETAFPGGRFEEGDETINHTALREANEEVGLPLDDSLVHVTTLPAVASRNFLVVVPVVYFLRVPDASAYLDATLVPSPSEVSHIFHAPIDMFLMRPSGTIEHERAKPLTYGFADYEWPTDKAIYRLHWFNHSSFSSMVSGLTADVVVSVAMLSNFGKEALYDTSLDRLGYERFAKGQMTVKQALQVTLDKIKNGDLSKPENVKPVSPQEQQQQ
ncbi:hypothetical protein ACM66B_004198 [Microbotryomycetes sp. NB124-2]